MLNFGLNIQQIETLTTDNGSNVLKVSRILEEQRNEHLREGPETDDRCPDHDPEAADIEFTEEQADKIHEGALEEERIMEAEDTNVRILFPCIFLTFDNFYLYAHHFFNYNFIPHRMT